MNELITLSRRAKIDTRRRSAGAHKTRLRLPYPSDDRAHKPPTPVAGVDPAVQQASMGQLPGSVCCELERLYTSLGQVTAASNPRTFKLLEAGTRKIAQKVIEEGGEVALEAGKCGAEGEGGWRAALPRVRRGVPSKRGARQYLAGDAGAGRCPRHRREAAEDRQPQASQPNAHC